jgi:hypothetical protein
MCDTAIRSELERATARYVLGQIRSSELVQLADEMLNRGVFSEGFNQLCGLSDHIMSETAPLFEAAMSELGVTIPSRADAKRLLATEFMKQVVGQQVNPLAGLVAFMDWIGHSCRSEESDQITFCKPLGLVELVSAHWSYDELEYMKGSRELSPQYYADEFLKLEQVVVDVAHRWLASTT